MKFENDCVEAVVSSSGFQLSRNECINGGDHDVGV
jgi:hypothetical protein